MSNPFDFKSLSDELRDALLAVPYFGDIVTTSGAPIVISADPHDIVTEINQALNEIGLALLVNLPVAHVGKTNLPGPVFDNVTIVVSIFELPTINRALNGGTNPTAYAAATQAAAILHLFCPEGVNDLVSVTDVIPIPDENYIRWEIHLRTQVAIQMLRTTIATVIADLSPPGDQTVTLTCATPGAAIFYTLDGTYPSPLGGTLSSGPIAIAAGHLLRARAWLAGYAPTNPAELNQQY